jgi:hypothetical protein
LESASWLNHWATTSTKHIPQTTSSDILKSGGSTSALFSSIKVTDYHCFKILVWYIGLTIECMLDLGSCGERQAPCITAPNNEVQIFAKMSTFFGVLLVKLMFGPNMLERSIIFCTLPSFPPEN